MPKADRRQRIGRRGEELAAGKLVGMGCEILARNYRCPHGEVDIICQDDLTLAFVEVRARTGNDYGSPEESVTLAKQARLANVAAYYLQEHGIGAADWRIDLVAVEFEPGGSVRRVEWIKNAVTE